MRALLDAHALLWYVRGDPRLPRQVANWIEDSGNTGILGAVDAWEIIIKDAKGKLKLAPSAVASIENWAREMLLERLEISFAHVYRVRDLPTRHGDPFDRLLAAQALVERVPIVTGDE